MGNIISNYAKGRFIEWATLPVGGDNIIVILFKAAGLPTDATLKNAQYLSDAVAAGAVIADFTNAARKVLSAVDITISVNTGTGVATFDISDQTWNSAGGAVNNSLGKFGVFYRKTSSDADTAIRCISFHDYVQSTNGVNLLAVVPSIGTAT